jgi:hypothetical protein
MPAIPVLAVVVILDDPRVTLGRPIEKFDATL